MKRGHLDLTRRENFWCRRATPDEDSSLLLCYGILIKKKKINKRREKGRARGAHLPGTLMEKQRKRVLCLDVRVDRDGLLILRKILIREKEKMKRNRLWPSIRANKFCSDIYVAYNWFFKIP